jgi:hypothetical protein
MLIAASGLGESHHISPVAMERSLQRENNSAIVVRVTAPRVAGLASGEHRGESPRGSAHSNARRFAETWVLSVEMASVKR